MSYAEHFSRRELTCTNTGFPNEPNSAQEAQLKALSRVLENLRGIVGKPLYINSAFRTVQVNNAVGGSRTSYHLYGKAADISIRNLDKNERTVLRRAIEARKPAEFIIYDTFYHVAFDFSKLGNLTPKPVTWQEEYPDSFPSADPRPSVDGDDY